MQSMISGTEKQKAFAQSGVKYTDLSQADYLKVAELVAYGFDSTGNGRGLKLPKTLALVREGVLLSALNALFKYPVVAGVELVKVVDKALATVPGAEASTYAYDLMFAARTGLEVVAGHMIGGLEINNQLQTIYSAMIPTSNEVFYSTGQEFTVLFCLADEVFSVLEDTTAA